jgi:hypothetical protein
MISSIGLVCAVALLSYVVLPLAGHLWVKQGWKRVLRRIRTEHGMTGLCTGYSHYRLRFLPGGYSGEEILIAPKQTAFFMLRRNEDPEKLAWRTLFLLQNGTTVYFIKSKKRFDKDICMFYEEKSTPLLREKISTLSVPLRLTNPLKPYFIAAGAFIEFLLLLEFIKDPAMNAASLAALVAIFGKALPYCPPGLFLTLAAVAPGKIKGIKKSRQRRAVGIFLVTLGIILNIGGIFFIIGYIGF